jgi:hypothetical protein
MRPIETPVANGEAGAFAASTTFEQPCEPRRVKVKNPKSPAISALKKATGETGARVGSGRGCEFLF